MLLTNVKQCLETSLHAVTVFCTYHQCHLHKAYKQQLAVDLTINKELPHVRGHGYVEWQHLSPIHMALGCKEVETRVLRSSRHQHWPHTVVDVDTPLCEHGTGVSELVGLGKLEEAVVGRVKVKNAPTKGLLIYGPQVVVKVEITNPVDSSHDNWTGAWWLINGNLHNDSM
jgi:hypothetical protein